MNRLLATIVLLLAFAHLGIAQPPLPGGPVLPPPPPLPASPVATFRHLLSLPAAERTNALATRSPRQREFLETRLAVYEAMAPALREERLRSTDLYWHLQQLIRRPASEHPTLLTSAPADLQPVLRFRLAFWNRLPPEDRTALLEHEGTLRYLAQMRTTVPPPLPTPVAAPTPTSLSAAPAVPLRVQAELSRLSQLSRTDQERIQGNWHQFFEGSAPRRERALQDMSAQERRDMERVLERFRRLSPEQRRSCVVSFARLATMAPPERSEFLRQAERWGSLPAGEREAWRQIVNKLPLFPPLPTSAKEPSLPIPPAPRRIATNGATP